ncbi:MAG: hypothetical protein AB1705_09085 [Verrucomicrobiota bacterium]
MKLTFSYDRRLRRSSVAFTMIEVALCLAIIAFALVAIIGILPTGMQVQKDNREETIIGQEGAFLLDALRSGQTNLDSLSNNLVYLEQYTNKVPMVTNYGPSFTGTTGELTAYQIVGILSTPKYPTNGIVTNYYTRAKFLANSGPLAERATTNRDLSFTYLLETEIVPYMVPTNLALVETNLAMNLTNNLYDVRLTLSWPVLPNNTVGNSVQVFRTLVAGELTPDTNQYYFFRQAYFNRY